ncbi:unnamed protein product [Ixodes pacificus]
MIFNVLTIFPEIFPGPLGCSVIGNALKKNMWSLNIFDIRGFAPDKHRTVDDRPYGGGPGMIMRADVIGRSVESILDIFPNTKLIYTSPKGARFNQHTAGQMGGFSNITILCGRFEGVDERVVSFYDFQEVSIGDYVLSGGELAAMVMIESCVRLIPGVVGNSASLLSESFDFGLEYPQYTRPAEWKGMSVPKVLLGGNHSEIERWKSSNSSRITKERRPDLLSDGLDNE